MSEACGNAQEEAKLKLEQARERYRISKAAEEKIAAEMEALKKSAQTTPEMIRNYEQYLDRSHAMTMENRNVVRDLEAVYAKGHQPREAPTAEGTVPATKPSGELIPEEQALDSLEDLDRRLNDSLAEFDEILLKEMDEILAKSNNQMNDLSEASEEAADSLENKSGEGEPPSEGPDKSAEPGKTSPGQAPGDNTTYAGEQSPGEGELSGGADDSDRQSPSGVSDQDDDIVARQLREAAEAETDPELKKKLWKEYENYKKGASL